ncbi:MAG: Na+/H+ antiporter NhaA [Caulobacter sp.]|nr:Na+/H+ antiporter NhaA [Caulobacter sp.]
MRKVIRKPLTALKHFLQSEASGGLVLMAVAALALIVANSPAAPAYFAALHAPLGGLDLLHWINDGLMAVFFLLVGLEIKRELVVGELNSWPLRVLPGFAAVGGMIVPALVFLIFTFRDPVAAEGWAIPAATDIAFALGVMLLLGSRVPTSLKILLTALAIIDDLGAVVIIALFHTSDLDLPAMAMAGATLAALVALNRFKVTRLFPYLLLGAVLWVFVLRSGVHATIAGVLLALTVPLGRGREGEGDDASPLIRLEHGLTPWAAFLVVPVFGFANAGVSLAGASLATVLAPVPLGIAAGLLIGKQVGVFGFGWLAIRLGWAALPEGASWRQFYGLSLLCGIGFTMSLFIGLLAYSDPALEDAAKLGVIVGSVLSGVAGWLVLRLAPPARA